MAEVTTIALSRAERRALWTLRLLRAAGLEPFVATAVDERLAERSTAELEGLRERWRRQPEADR